MYLEVGKVYYGEKGPKRRIIAITPLFLRRAYRVKYARIRKDGSDGAAAYCGEEAFERWAKGVVEDA